MSSERKNIQVSSRKWLSDTASRVGGWLTGSAGLLRLAAGRPARIGTPVDAPMLTTSRRGSFLIMVVGTLALLSVIVVIYVSVGSQDRRMAAVANRNSRINDIIGVPKGYGPDGYTVVPGSYADQVLGILRDDLFTMVPDREVATGKYLGTFRREAWDYPSTSPLVDSWKENPKPQTDPLLTEYFRPEGEGTDPWLASTRPEDLGFAKDTNGGTAPSDFVSWKRRVDWPHISNVAPDGRFVNLGNLRNNFSSPSGFGTTIISGRTSQRTSYGLTLLKLGSYTPDGVPVYVDADQQGLTSDWRQRIPAINGDPKVGDLYHRTFFWDTRQMGAFRPADGTYYGTASRVPVTNGVKATSLPEYQWADADGDGFFDARWQEMVDARGTGLPRSIIPTDEKYRFFFATRIVDLSSMVNVNTAGDLFTPPTAKFPLGSTPTDIDLARVLSLEDLRTIYAELNKNSTKEKINYAELVQPKDAGGADDYSKYNNDSDPNLTLKVGKSSYLALRQTLATGQVPPQVDTEDFIASNGAMDGTKLGKGYFFKDAEARAKYYFSGAGAQSTGIFAADDAVVGDVRVGDPLGIESAIELLGFRGVNDPTDTSRLEAAVGGRYRPAPPNDFPALSPLRSNRGLALEQQGRDSSGDGVMEKQAAIWSIADARQYLTTVNGSRPLWAAPLAKDQLATLQADRPVALSASSDLRFALEETIATPADMFRKFAAALAPYASEKWAWPGPEAKVTAADFTWTTPNGREAMDIDYKNAATMFYGYKGPEAAVLLSAMMAVNTSAAMDGDLEYPVTVALDGDYRRDDLTKTGGIAQQDIKNFSWWFDFRPRGTTGGTTSTVNIDGQNFIMAMASDGTPAGGIGRFDLDPKANFSGTATEALLVANDAKLRYKIRSGNAGGVDKLRSPAINLYGVTPQPFITGVMSITAFTDAPVSVGGDVDSKRVPPDQDFPDAPEITIDGTITNANPDFLFRIVAFQIHNPFDQEITVGKPIAENATIKELEGNGGIDIIENGQNNNSYYIKLRGRDPNSGSSEDKFDDISRFMLVALKDPKAASDASKFDIADMQGTIPTSPGTWRDSDDDKNARVMSIKLKPGETAVCFASSQSPRRITKRVQNVWVKSGSGSGGSQQFSWSFNTFANMVVKQFGGKVSNGASATKVYWIPQVDDNGKVLLENDKVQPLLFKPDPNPSAASQAAAQKKPVSRVTSVELWRSLQNESERRDVSATSTVSIGLKADGSTYDKIVAGRNATFNDQLVDRMRIGPVSTSGKTWSPAVEDNLDRRLPAGDGTGKGKEITDTLGIIQGNSPQDSDDTGMTISLWSAWMRPSDPEPSSVNGRIPAYCIEPREELDDKLWNIPKFDDREENKGNEDNAYDNKMSRDQFLGKNDRSGVDRGSDSSVRESAKTVADWWSKGMSTGGVALSKDFLTEPSKRTLDKARDPKQGGSQFIDVAKQFSMPAYNTGNRLNQQPPFGSPSGLRAGDVLRSLAIAPYHDPLATDSSRSSGSDWVGSGTKDVQEFTRVTLGEVLAFQFGYYNADGSGVPKDQSVLSLFVATEDRDSALKKSIGTTMLDAGHLFLDRYTPYMDMDNTPGFDATKDIRVGLGVPMALNLIDSIQGLPPRLASLTKPTRGLININTAPVDVLRTLPLLAPNIKGFEGSELLSGVERTGGWPTGITRPLDDKTDIAAMIVSYRDKRPENFRPQAADELGVNWADFSDLRPTGSQRTYPNELGGKIPVLSEGVLRSALGATLGRSKLNLIDAVREEPGFRSIGELMCVREVPKSGSGQARNVADRKDHSSNIDYLGYNGKNDSFVGVDPSYKDSEFSGGGDNANKLVDEYNERLTVMSAISNLVTVRSDLYVCWFVVAGFQKSDCVGLTDQDPLVPSIKRRFMMVIDRSNVTQPTDTPRVLVWKELPL